MCIIHIYIYIYTTAEAPAVALLPFQVLVPEALQVSRLPLDAEKRNRRLSEVRK